MGNKAKKAWEEFKDLIVNNSSGKRPGSSQTVLTDSTRKSKVRKSSKTASCTALTLKNSSETSSLSLEPQESRMTVTTNGYPKLLDDLSYALQLDEQNLEKRLNGPFHYNPGPGNAKFSLVHLDADLKAELNEEMEEIKERAMEVAYRDLKEGTLDEFAGVADWNKMREVGRV